MFMDLMNPISLLSVALCVLGPWKSHSTLPPRGIETACGVKEKSCTVTFVVAACWVPACPEFGSTISEDESTASNDAAVTVFSSSRTSLDQPSPAAPVKNQSPPL